MSLSDLPGHVPDPSRGRIRRRNSTAALAEPERRVRPSGSPAWCWSTSASTPRSSAPSRFFSASRRQHFDEADKEAILALVTGAAPPYPWWPIRCSAPSATAPRPASAAGCRGCVFGAVLGAAALIALAGAPNVAVMMLLWCLVQAGCNGAYAAITAAIPDRVPVPAARHRGRAGRHGPDGGDPDRRGDRRRRHRKLRRWGTWSAPRRCLPASCCIFFKNDDVPLPAAGPPAVQPGRLRPGFWIYPARYPDFAWAWLTRLPGEHRQPDGHPVPAVLPQRTPSI